jgi:hypothetical protein
MLLKWSALGIIIPHLYRYGTTISSYYNHDESRIIVNNWVFVLYDMLRFFSRNVIRTMDPIDSYAKDIKVVRVSSTWEMWVMFAFLGKSCVVVGGGSWGATHTTILKERAASANHQCQVSRFERLVLYRGFPIGFKLARSFGACLVLLLTMGPFKEAHMCPTCLEIASSL